jgi:PST family polysaccharide transporter
VLRGGLTRVGAQGALVILRVGSIMVLARLLEPADFGLVNMVAVVTGLFGLFRDAGLSMVTVQRATISHAQVSALFWLNMLVGACLMALSAAAAPAVAAFYHEPRLFWVAIALGTGFLFSGAGVQHAALLQRQMRFAALAMVDLTSYVIAIAVGISMAMLGYGYWALVGMDVSQSIASCAAVWASVRWVPGLPHRGVGMASMTRFGGIVSVNGFLTYVAYNTDKLLLGRFAGAETLGLYGRAYGLVSVPTQVLHQAVSGVALSALSRLQTDAGRFRSYFLKGYSVFVSVAIPITVACSLFASDIVLVILGPKWTAAAPIFRFLAPTVVAFALINPVGWLLFATGRVERSLKMAFVIAPLLIAAYAVGLSYGPAGVAIGFSATMTALIVPLVVWGLHDSVVPPREVAQTVKAPALAAVVATVITLPAALWFGGLIPPVLRLACEGALFSVSYVLFLFYPMRQKAFYAALIQDVWQRQAAAIDVHG